MEEVKVIKEWDDGSVILTGDDFVSNRSTAGGFYARPEDDTMHLTVFSSNERGESVDVNLRLDFETVETIRNQLDVWVVKHWPQE